MTVAIDKTVRESAVENPASTRVFEKLGIDYCCGGNRSLFRFEPDPFAKSNGEILFCSGSVVGRTSRVGRHSCTLCCRGRRILWNPTREVVAVFGDAYLAFADRHLLDRDIVDDLDPC